MIENQIQRKNSLSLIIFCHCSLSTTVAVYETQEWKDDKSSQVVQQEPGHAFPDNSAMEVGRFAGNSQGFGQNRPRFGNQFSYHNYRPRKPREELMGCALCKSAEHRIGTCSKFISKNEVERGITIKAHRLCFKCFSNTHFDRNCPVMTYCTKCEGTTHNGQICGYMKVLASVYSASNDATHGPDIIPGSQHLEVDASNGAAGGAGYMPGLQSSE